MSNFKALMESLIQNSTFQQSQDNITFTQVRDEWELINVEQNGDWNKCLCGKDIKELCYIKNKFNSNVLIVSET